MVLNKQVKEGSSNNESANRYGHDSLFPLGYILHPGLMTISETVKSTRLQISLFNQISLKREMLNRRDPILQGLCALYRINSN